MASGFAPCRPFLGEGIRDKAEVLRLLTDYVDVLAESKAVGTWQSYAPHWDQFRYWVAFTVGPYYSFKQLAAFEWLPRTYAMHLWEKHADTDTVLAQACTAINLGFELQGCDRIMNQPCVALVKAAKRRARTTPVKRSLAMQQWMLQAMMEKWWLTPRRMGRKVSTGRLMIIIWSMWSSLTLARFADASRFFWDALWFMPSGKGVLVTVDKRKNRQNHSGSQLMIGFSGSRYNLGPLILEYLKRCGGWVDDGGYVKGVSGPVFRKLFRVTTKVKNGKRISANYSHLTKVVYNVCTKVPSKVTYGPLLKWFRAALVQTCGFSVEEAEMFGTHSLRRGGNNIAQDKGIAGNVVIQIGEWASLRSQRVYNERELSEQLSVRMRMAF